MPPAAKITHGGAVSGALSNPPAIRKAAAAAAAAGHTSRGSTGSGARRPAAEAARATAPTRAARGIRRPVSSAAAPAALTRSTRVAGARCAARGEGAAPATGNPTAVEGVFGVMRPSWVPTRFQ
ncbi:unnamed protein product [Closterium sp. NIES-53]